MNEETHRILSHRDEGIPLARRAAEIRERIQAEGDKPHVTVERQLQLLEELQGFELGRFLLSNGGLNGYWTHYILTHPTRGRPAGRGRDGRPISVIESIFLDRLPTVLATQQRFTIFRRVIQAEVKSGRVLASIPCGVMGDLLTLDYSGIENIHLVGIDLDPESLGSANGLAGERGLAATVDFLQKDAWDLGIRDEFDLIASSGLNIYEPDDERVTELYRQFFLALRPGGLLVTSFLTPPPGGETCEWKMERLDQKDLLLQKIIFGDILRVKWQFYRTAGQTRSQLDGAGFDPIQWIDDDARIFPTVVARKRGP